MLTSLFGPQFVRRSCGEHWIADMFGLLCVLPQRARLDAGSTATLEGSEDEFDWLHP